VFSRSIGFSCPECVSQAPQVLCLLQSFWTGRFIRSNLDGGRSGKDSGTLLGINYAFNPRAGCDDATFQPCSARALASHHKLMDTFRDLYDINADRSQDQAVAIGRYPEDQYSGGNPWFLCTLAAAEQLYSAIYQWNRLGSITITQVSLPFFQNLHPSAVPGTYVSSTEIYYQLVDAVHTYADGFMRIVVCLFSFIDEMLLGCRNLILDRKHIRPITARSRSNFQDATDLTCPHTTSHGRIRRY